MYKRRRRGGAVGRFGDGHFGGEREEKDLRGLNLRWSLLERRRV